MISCVYRHISSSILIEEFSNEHQKMSFENKTCVLVGAFNIDLLNKTRKFIQEPMYIIIFIPYILGIKIVIDNIFVNTIEYPSKVYR